jgi:hypothetical protein
VRYTHSGRTYEYQVRASLVRTVERRQQVVSGNYGDAVEH